MKQTWGTAHVTDVLTGKATEKVVAARHHELSTFGLLKEEAAGGDSRLHRAAGRRRSAGARRRSVSGAAADAGRARRCCAATGDCVLYREVKPPVVRKRKPRRRCATAFAVTVDSDLFDVLRDVRLRLARERGVPPYVIFHDTTLRDMVERRPKTLDDLHEIYGVGAKKAADFGDAFLDAIRTFRRPE